MSAEPTTLMDEVRSILRSAGGPITAHEIRETLGDTASSGGVGSSLHSLVKRGEVVHDRDVYPGTYTLASTAGGKAPKAHLEQQRAASPPASTADKAPKAAAKPAAKPKRQAKPKRSKPAPRAAAAPPAPPAPADLGLVKRATRKQLRVQNAGDGALRTQVVAVPTADTPTAELLKRLAACVIATWPLPLEQMPAQLAAQCIQALGLPEAA